MKRNRTNRIVILFAAIAAMTPALFLLLGAARAPDYAFAFPGFITGFAVVMLFAARRWRGSVACDGRGGLPR